MRQNIYKSLKFIQEHLNKFSGNFSQPILVCLLIIGVQVAKSQTSRFLDLGKNPFTNIYSGTPVTLSATIVLYDLDLESWADESIQPQ
jgi:hypothetical protein